MWVLTYQLNNQRVIKMRSQMYVTQCSNGVGFNTTIPRGKRHKKAVMIKWHSTKEAALRYRDLTLFSNPDTYRYLLHNKPKVLLNVKYDAGIRLVKVRLLNKRNTYRILVSVTKPCPKTGRLTRSLPFDPIDPDNNLRFLLNWAAKIDGYSKANKDQRLHILDIMAAIITDDLVNEGKE